MRAFHHPAAGTLAAGAPSAWGRLAPLGDVRDVAPGPHGPVRRLARVSLIAAKVLAAARGPPRAADDDPVQRGFEERHIMPLGAAHD